MSAYEPKGQVKRTRDIVAEMQVDTTEPGVVFVWLPISWKGRLLAGAADEVVLSLFERGALRHGERVIYRESEGLMWNEMQHVAGVFTGYRPIGALTLDEAKAKVRSQRRRS